MQNFAKPKTFGPHLKHVVTRMCKVVGADMRTMNFLESGWQDKHQWTLDQRYRFSRWLTNYLLHNKDARNEMMTIPINSKKRCKEFSDAFVHLFSWSVKRETHNIITVKA